MEVRSMHIIYGGAFNPPTIAHLEVYKFLKRKLDVRRFTYLPVSSAYTKSELVSNTHRLNMLKLMTKDYDDIDISDIEMTDDRFQGTYYSLVRLSDDTDDEVGFVIGADNVKGLSNWIMAPSLLSEFTIIILNRDDIDVQAIIDNDPLLKRYKSHFKIYKAFDLDVSSTAFRITHDQTMVTDEVYNYIKDQDLY